MKTVKLAMNLFVILTLFLLTACSGEEKTTTSGSSNEAGSSGGTMFLGMVNPPTGFNPINSGDVAAVFLQKFMFESFLEMDGALNFEPKLAESFETTDNQTFTIKLNKDAKWSDGTPVSAEDVEFTFNLVANPLVETSVGAYISTFEGLDSGGKLPEGETEIPSVEIIDEKTIQFKTVKPVDPNMIKEQLGAKLLILPKHVLGEVDPAKLSQHPFMQKPTVTNGPFKFVQYAKDQYVEFEANTDYYLGAPELSKLFVKIMPAANMVAQLQTGELHMNVAGGIGKIIPTDYETVDKLENITTSIEPTIGFQTMMFNTETIKDVKVRQAITYALDRQKIVDNLLKGNGEVVDGPYTSVSPYLNKDVESYTYNQEKAKELLEEVSWDFDQTIKLVVPTGNKVREQSADLITQDLEAIGLKVEMTTYDFPTIMQKGAAGEFDLLLIGFTFTLDPEISALYAPNGTYNFMSFENKRVTELLTLGKAEPSAEVRKEIYNELQEIHHNELPYISLYSDSDYSAVSNDVLFGKPKVFGFHHELQKWAVSGAK
ncbi:ABC transporter substrate-binding protein [Litchfieldia salsa]|uniref:Peptide/nickel transport system substrate-binding protein n=1 Tax=Litchfieldia salsa TaxID=930152 RepID=A0A1H0RI87_9BACI|nr:ABC transporter substrate-binding protein [Litchfieldia salsa]SDP29282.1 peptide/nickel transport system substrate-binding protein [Litchfieldia salsa]